MKSLLHCKKRKELKASIGELQWCAPLLESKRHSITNGPLQLLNPRLSGLGCAPNLLQSSTSMILSTSNEYSLNFTTSQKTLKPMLSLHFSPPMTTHCKNYVQRYLQFNYCFSPNYSVECWKWSLHFVHNDGRGMCFSQHWDSMWTNPLFSQVFHYNLELLKINFKLQVLGFQKSS